MGVRWRLGLASALMLFLELALIRWLGANIVHLSYFSNFVLLGSFLGIGLGFLRAARPQSDPLPTPLYSVVALLGLVGFVSAYPVTVSRSSSQLIFFTSLATKGPAIWVTLPAVFLAVALVMAGPGEIVGACFGQLPRLEAYRLDLIGSLSGIVTFTALSFLGAPPLVWFTIAGLLFIVLLGRVAASVSVTLLVALVLLFGYPLRHDKNVFWSPYYKVTAERQPDPHGGTLWALNVNGIPHQKLTTAASRETNESFYLQSYRDLPRPPKRVLIVGAGTGTDVAIALDQGAQYIDAVEIDPTLLRFGRDHNPNHAYQNPRVHAHVDDGRAFLERSNAKYDLVIFALPDSLTLVSGASSLRLESYLFTEQAFRAARAHVAAGGAFSMYNFYRQQWLIDRLAGTMQTVFGHAPCVWQNPQSVALAVMTVGRTAADQVCGNPWVRPPGTVKPASDDKPFLYLKGSSIPSLYRTALLLILLGSAVAIAFVLMLNAGSVRIGRQVREMWSYRDLFLLGAAFLLLETKSVTGFALLFGTTWVVNALVFAGVLVAVLAAVEVTHRASTPPLPVMYGVLLGGLALSWLVPASWLLDQGVALRAVLAVAISFLPIFAANVIFAKRFADTADAPMAFGTNLLGAILGGCLEYLSLVFGYRALLVLAAILYVTAYLVMPRFRGASGAAGAAEPALAGAGRSIVTRLTRR